MIICCGLVNHFWICFGRFGEQPAKKVVWFVFLNPTVDNQFWSTACFIHMKFRVLTPQNYWRLVKLGGNFLGIARFFVVESLLMLFPFCYRTYGCLGRNQTSTSHPAEVTDEAAVKAKIRQFGAEPRVGDVRISRCFLLVIYSCLPQNDWRKV